MWENLKFKKEESLRIKTLRSSIFVFLYRIIQQILNMIKIIILARILSPNDFGIMGIGLLAINTIDIFTQTGIYQALIQKKGEIGDYLSDAWTFLLLRGLLLSILLFSFSPLIGKFFNSKDSINVLKVLSIYFILQSSSNIAVIVLFQKELEFGIFFLYQFFGIISDFLVSIVLAFVLKNFWALVFGYIAKGFVLMVSSYFIHPYKPKIKLRKEILLPLFSFGKWIFISSILLFFLNQGGDIFVGKILGTYFLGLYQMAFRISNLPTTEITWMLSQVTFPVYSKIQDEKEKLKIGYLLTLSSVSIFSFLFLSFIIVFAKSFTLLFLGEKWIKIVLPMQVLSIFGVLRAFSATTGSLFQGVGKPHLATRYQFFRFIILCLIIYPFTKYFGILGTCFAILMSAIFVDPFAIFHALKIIKEKIENFLNSVYIPFLSFLLSSFILFLFQKVSINKNNFFNFFIQFFLLLFFYFFFIFLFTILFKNKYIDEIKKIFLNFFKKT
jgi:O-antigen/teichoic acid export membrane protein